MKVLIDRVNDNGYSTLGVLYVLSDSDGIIYQCNTLELPFKGNRANISSIPKGKYQVKKRVSEKYGEHFHILDVPNRRYILIHQANYVHQLRGCIAVGSDFKDIDHNEELDVVNSKRTMNELLNILPKSFYLQIQ